MKNFYTVPPLLFQLSVCLTDEPEHNKLIREKGLKTFLDYLGHQQPCFYSTKIWWEKEQKLILELNSAPDTVTYTGLWVSTKFEVPIGYPVALNAFESGGGFLQRIEECLEDGTLARFRMVEPVPSVRYYLRVS